MRSASSTASRQRSRHAPRQQNRPSLVTTARNMGIFSIIRVYNSQRISAIYATLIVRIKPVCELSVPLARTSICGSVILLNVPAMP